MMLNEVTVSIKCPNCWRTIGSVKIAMRKQRQISLTCKKCWIVVEAIFDVRARSDEHPTQMPLMLMEWDKAKDEGSV